MPDCWTIFQDGSGRWRYSYAIPDPDPAPLTTIGWQVVHVATSKLMYHEHAYGAARLAWPELEVPHTAVGAVALLERGHALLRSDLAGLSGEAALDEPRRTNWGETWPAWRLFAVMIDHDALHAGAIGCIRNIYAWRSRRLEP